MVLGGLLLLLLGAAGVLLARFDADRAKALAVDWMQAEHQRTLAIDGAVRLSLVPRLALEVSGLRLSERGSDAGFAAIDEASVALQWLPLLRGRWVADRIGARGVRVTLVRDARGVRNIDDLLARGARPPAGPATPAATPAPLDIDISALQFDDLRLRLRDDMAALAGDVTVQTLSMGRLAAGAGAPVTLRATAQLTQPLAATLQLDGRMTLQPDPARSGVVLSGLQLGVQGEAAGVRALALALEGTLAWDGRSWRAGPLQLALKSAAYGGWTLAPSTLTVGQALFSAAEQRAELDTLKLALGGRQGAQGFELALDWPRLVVDARHLEGSALTGRFQLSGPNTLGGELRSAVPGGRFDAVRVPGLALTLAGQLGPRRVDLRSTADLVLDAGRRSALIEQLDLRATLAEPGAPPLDLRVQGRGQAGLQAASARLTGSLHTSRFALEAAASFGGPRPRLKADARFDRLDLNTLLAPAAPAPPATAASAAAGDTPVNLDGLKALDGEFSLDAGALAFRHYRATDARLAATLDGGRLRIGRIAGRAWGGSVEGSGSADAHAHRVALRLDARGVDVQALLKDVAGQDLLEGSGRVLADLESGGTTVAALRSQLAGRAELQLRDGAIRGFNLARALRQAKAALSLRQDAIVQSRAVEKTDFSALDASLHIADGVARSDDLELKSPFLRLGGAGSFDIGRGRIDYTARATVTDTAAGQGGAGLEALRGVTVPVQLSGPFDAIDWKVQWSAVATAALRHQLKDKLGEALGGRLGTAPGQADAASAPRRPEDLLKDRLRRLLK